MKQILIPTDFSQNAQHAACIAAEIAEKSNAKVIVMHANTQMSYAPVFPEYGGVTPDMTAYYETAADELKAFKKDVFGVEKFGHIPIETRIEEGYLHSGIRRIAEDDNIDLVVMGTKGAQGAAEFFIGSNAEKVIRTAPCPVLAVPETAASNFDPRIVVLSSTLKLDQLVAFETLSKWQKIYPFEVKVLYLNNPAQLNGDAEIEKTINAFAQKSGLKNITVYASNDTFNEEQSILKFAQKHKADMIAMATHQRRGLSHMLFGSLTEDAVNHSEIPVLAVPIK